jgi:hypothetical protein
MVVLPGFVLNTKEKLVRRLMLLGLRITHDHDSGGALVISPGLRRKHMEANSDGIKYTIEQVAQMVGVHKSTLRYWGKVFNIVTPRSAGNQRQYPQDQIDLLKRIKELYDQGMSVKGVWMNLAEDQADVAKVS